MKSQFERLFPPFCDDYAIRRPAFNVAIGPYVVDALWARERLVVELDSRAFHSDPAAFERDRKRDADLQVWGYRVIRITWRRLHRRARGGRARHQGVAAPRRSLDPHA